MVPTGVTALGGLVQGADGSLYGTTYGYISFCDNGDIFRFSLDGDVTKLLSFDGTDGAYPAAGLTQGPDGTFYGTTCDGGTDNGGTVFAITSGGVLSTLCSFSPPAPEALSGPVAALSEGSDGNFYGITTDGGSSNCLGLGCGTIFKITPSGVLTTLHSFTPEESEPWGGLVQGTDGRFYGTTASGTVYALYVGLHPFVEIVPITGAMGTAS